MYEHKIQYYETDKMGITHHSNYIRFMEEARVDWLDRIGWSFAKLEGMGLTSPVLSVKCEYKKSTTYSDIILIKLSLDSYNGIKMKIKYEMTNKETNEVVAIGETQHCFLNDKGFPIIIKKSYPEFDTALKKCINQ